MILGLRTAIYPAPDLGAARLWYSKVLGQSPYFDEPFYVGFSVGGFELGLLPSAQPGTAGPQPLWGVENIESAHARLLELGASALEPVFTTVFLANPSSRPSATANSVSADSPVPSRSLRPLMSSLSRLSKGNCRSASIAPTKVAAGCACVSAPNAEQPCRMPRRSVQG